MEKEKFNEIITKIGYEREKWYSFHEIESIYLTSGKGFYPSWRHLRFLITKNDKILIKHGRSVPYGAKLNGLTMLSGDYTGLSFIPGDRGFQIEVSPYSEGFRQPKVGDAVRVTEGSNKMYGESYIKDIKPSLNTIILFLWTPIQFPRTGRVSYYDSQILSSDKENCMHSTMQEGVYMNFKGNDSKKKYFGSSYHEEIKIKDIKEINLLIGKEYYNKTYKLE